MVIKKYAFSSLFAFLVGLLFVSFAHAIFLDDGSSSQTVYDCGILNTTNAVYTFNQSVSSSGTCIAINASNVTLNLGGYNLTGNQTGYGVRIYWNSTILNGTIINFTSGIYHRTSNATDTVIRQINSSENVETGIDIGYGVRSLTIQDVQTNFNWINGTIYDCTLCPKEQILISNLTSNHNGFSGLVPFFTVGSVIRDSNLSHNNYSGIWGLVLGNISLERTEIFHSNADGFVIEGYDTSFCEVSLNNTIIKTDSGIGNYSILHNGGTNTLNIRIYNSSIFGRYSFNKTRLNFVSSENDSIDYEELFNISGYNLSSDIQISRGFAYVNSSVLGLNQSANITFYNLWNSTGFINQSILRDGVECSDSTVPSCSNFTNLNETIVKFNVSSWSNYSFYRGLDVLSPSVTLKGAPNSKTTSSAVFEYNVSENYGIKSCSFMISGTVYSTNSSTVGETGNTISASGLSAGTAYIGLVNCTDIANNSAVSSGVNFTTSVEEEEVTEESSGGGGGSDTTDTTWKQVYGLVSQFNNEKQVSKELKDKEGIRIQLDGKNKYIRVYSLSSSKVVLNISSSSTASSGSIQDTVLLEENRMFEVTDDNYYDFNITYVTYNNSKANISIQYVHVEVPEEKPKSQDNSNSTLGSGSSNSAGGNQSGLEVEDELEGDLNFGEILIWVGILIAVAGLIGGIFYYLYKIEKSGKKK